MLISVVYNDGQILFCNADCVVGNLLNYIKKQTGNLDCEVVDLADETGLVLELDENKMQYASKRLADKGSTFIVVEKKQKDPNDEDYDPVIPYCYSALLDDCASLYPEIKTFYTISMEEKRRAKTSVSPPSKSPKRGGGGTTQSPVDSRTPQKPGEKHPSNQAIGKGKKKQA